MTMSTAGGHPMKPDKVLNPLDGSPLAEVVIGTTFYLRSRDPWCPGRADRGSRGRTRNRPERRGGAPSGSHASHRGRGYPDHGKEAPEACPRLPGATIHPLTAD